MGLQLQQLQDEVPGSELLLPPSPCSASPCHCGGRGGETVFRLRFWLGLSFHCIWIWIWLWLGLSHYIIRVWLRIWFFPPSALPMLPTNLQWIWILLPTNLQWIWLLPTNLQWIWLLLSICQE